MFRMLGCKSTGAHANEIDHNLLYQALFFFGGGGGGIERKASERSRLQCNFDLGSCC